MGTVDIKDYATYIGITMLMKGVTVSPLKLQKILYYEQAWYMVCFGRENTLFENAPEAWVNGKVPGMCEHLRYEDFDTDEEKAQKRAIELKESMQLNKEEIDLTEQVIMLYGTKTQNQLILLTLSEKPWSEKREGLMPYEYSNELISLDTMYNYYKERYDRNRAKK